MSGLDPTQLSLSSIFSRDKYDLICGFHSCEMWFTVFWVVMPCKLAGVTYKNTQCHNPEDHDPQVSQAQHTMYNSCHVGSQTVLWGSEC
jgi:hypothetical protein